MHRKRPDLPVPAPRRSVMKAAAYAEPAVRQHLLGGITYATGVAK